MTDYECETCHRFYSYDEYLNHIVIHYIPAEPNEEMDKAFRKWLEWAKSQEQENEQS